MAEGIVSLAQLPSDSMLRPIDLLRVLDRLPAELRAKVRWVRPIVHEAITSVRATKLTAESIDAATRKLWKPMAGVVGVLLAHLSRDELSGVLNEASASLRIEGTAGLDPDSADTFEWCVAILDAVRRFLMAVMPGDASALDRPTDEPLDLALADPVMGGLLRGQTLLLAAALDASAPPGAENQETSAELIAEAYLQLCTVLDGLRTLGVLIDPFADDTRSDRGQRALRAAAALRATLSDDDARELASGRLHALR